jgi:hypothetical protein
MQIEFGKHYGTSLEPLVLKDPVYVAWMLSVQEPGRGLQRAVAHARRLIGMFDAKPFVTPCSWSRPATRCTAYAVCASLAPWCDECDPYSQGAARGKLTEIRTYQDALNLGFSNTAPKRSMKSAVRNLARAKGLPDRVGELDAQQFFGLTSENTYYYPGCQS